MINRDFFLTENSLVDLANTTGYKRNQSAATQ